MGMEPMIESGAAMLGTAALMMVAQLCAWLLTRRPLINRKPFNCHACATFWLTICLMVDALFVFEQITPQNAALCLLAALFNYLYIKTRIEIYE